MRQLKMRETDVKDLSKRIDENARTLTKLQEKKEKEKKEKEELISRIKLLEARESKQYDLIQTYALKLSHGKGADPHPNACKKTLNQPDTGGSTLRDGQGGNKTYTKPQMTPVNTKNLGGTLGTQTQPPNLR